MKQEYLDGIVNALDAMHPDARSELNFGNIYELVVAVMLSAQTTDVRVNIVTPALFRRYPSFTELKDAELGDVEELIRTVGLYKTKAKNLIECARIIAGEYGNEVPDTMEELLKLPGVGRKTASVILIEGHNIPALPVDTHVERVSKRLGLANRKDDAHKVEERLKKLYPPSRWRKLHHQLILLGRYTCLARKPKCEQCLLNTICPKKGFKAKGR